MSQSNLFGILFVVEIVINILTLCQLQHTRHKTFKVLHNLKFVVAVLSASPLIRNPIRPIHHVERDSSRCFSSFFSLQLNELLGVNNLLFFGAASHQILVESRGKRQHFGFLQTLVELISWIISLQKKITFCVREVATDVPW